MELERETVLTAMLSVATQVKVRLPVCEDVLRSNVVELAVNELITGDWLSVLEMDTFNVSVVVLPAASPIVAVIVLVELPKLKSEYKNVLVKLKVLPLWLTKVASVTDLEVIVLLSVATTAKVTVWDWELVVRTIVLSLTENELIEGSWSSFLVTDTVRLSVDVLPCVSVTVAVKLSFTVPKFKLE